MIHPPIVNRILPVYRAWDLKNKWMILPDSCWDYSILFDGNVQELQERRFAGISQYENVEVGTEDLFLMQWTGLTDKKEAKVFDGDIVAIEKMFEIENDDGTLYRESVGIKHYFISSQNGMFIQVRGRERSLFGGFNYNPIDVEVIGNIFENPELLEPLRA